MRSESIAARPPALVPDDRARLAPAADWLARYRFECWQYDGSIGSEGRGQGCALLGLLEYLPTEHDGFAPIAAGRRLSTALAAAQHPSGHWPTLVHEPGTCLETSACLFAATGFARGLRQELLGPEFREPCLRAWRAGLGAADADGLVAGASAIVWASTSPDHYRNVPRSFLVPWGQGPLHLAANELHAGAGEAA